MAKWSGTKVTQLTYSEYRSYRGGSRWDAIQKARAIAEAERIRAALEIEHARSKGEKKRRIKTTIHDAKLLILALEREEMSYSDWIDTKKNYQETGMIIIGLDESIKDRKNKKYEAVSRKQSYKYGSFECWPPKKKRIIVERLKEISKLLGGEITESEKKRLLTEKDRYFSSERERVENLWG